VRNDEAIQRKQATSIWIASFLAMTKGWIATAFRLAMRCIELAVTEQFDRLLATCRSVEMTKKISYCNTKLYNNNNKLKQQI
jgi:hypothetical protein